VEPTAAHSSVFTAAEVADIRERLEALVRAIPDLTPERRADLTLAASELMTNATEHGTGDDATVDVCVLDGAIILTVTNRCDTDVPPIECWTMPPVLQPRGRGLAIVKASADHVVVCQADGGVTISATFLLAEASGNHPPRTTLDGTTAATPAFACEMICDGARR